MAWILLSRTPLHLLAATVLAVVGASSAYASDVLVGEAANFDNLVSAREFALVEL